MTNIIEIGASIYLRTYISRQNVINCFGKDLGYLEKTNSCVSNHKTLRILQ